MLTEVELCTVKYILRTLCRYGSVDLDFEENTDHPLQRTKSKWKRQILLARTTFSLCYLIFAISRIPITLNHYQRTKEFDDCVIHGILILLRGGNILHQATAVENIGGIAQLLNNLISLNTKFGQLHFNTKYLEPNIREKLLRGCVNVLMTAAFFCGCLFLAKPDSPAYLFSVLPIAFHENYITFLFFLILELWTVYDAVTLLNLFLLIEFVHIFSTKYWLKYLCSNQYRKCKERGTNNVEADRFGIGKRSLNLYHQLYILNTLQGSTFGRHYLPALKLIVGLMSTLTFYTVVKLGRSLNLLLYLFAISAATGSYVILIPATYAMSEIYNYSSKYQSEQLRAYLNATPTESVTRTERKLFLQNNRSCGVIRCKIGSLYWMEKDAKATLIQLLVSGTSNLLLTFK